MEPAERERILVGLLAAVGLIVVARELLGMLDRYRFAAEIDEEGSIERMQEQVEGYLHDFYNRRERGDESGGGDDDGWDEIT